MAATVMTQAAAPFTFIETVRCYSSVFSFLSSSACLGKLKGFHHHPNAHTTPIVII
jgi:hypothetical protein